MLTIWTVLLRPLRFALVALLFGGSPSLLNPRALLKLSPQRQEGSRPLLLWALWLAGSTLRLKKMSCRFPSAALPVPTHLLPRGLRRQVRNRLISHVQGNGSSRRRPVLMTRWVFREAPENAWYVTENTFDTSKSRKKSALPETTGGVAKARLTAAPSR